MKCYDVIVVGGGLAGLTAALHLTGKGCEVLLIEKHGYPRHKVCGEYLSNEVKPYLESLGVTLEQAKQISQLQLSAPKCKGLTATLPLGGMGISRFTLDNTLYQKVLDAGAAVVTETVVNISRPGFNFTVTTNSGDYQGRIVIGAYGKRASLDKKLGRSFMQQSSPWLAVKAHYEHPDWPENLVGLHTFRGGYAGISKTESGLVNFCYLATYQRFRKSGNIDSFTTSVLTENECLREFLDAATMVFDEPMSIAQISFRRKEAVTDGILMCGDTAGMIHPLCGNGMAMAIHSAKMASEHIIAALESSTFDLSALGDNYRREWHHTFSSRLAFGRIIQSALLEEWCAGMLVELIAHSPWLLQKIIQATHGKPIGG